MYTLKKLSIEEGKSSLVPAGHETTAENLFLYKADTDERYEIEELDDLEENLQVILMDVSRPWNGRYHRTSPIDLFLEILPNKVTFKTQTSYYELTHHD